MLTREEVERSVKETYRKRYPSYKDVKVSEIAFDTMGGALVAIDFKEDGSDDEEMCFVTMEKSVVIFGTTPDLVRFVETYLLIPPPVGAHVA